MATTSYRTLPSSTYGGLGYQGDFSHSTNYGIYNSGIGSLPSHQTTHPANNHQQSSYSNAGYSIQQKPRYYLRDRYAEHSTYNPEPLVNNYTNPRTHRYNNRSTIPNNIDGRYALPTTNHTHLPYKTIVDRHHVESNNQFQTSYAGPTQYYPPASYDNQQQQSPPNRVRSEYQIFNNPSKQPFPARHRSPSTSGNSYENETTTKRNHFSSEVKTTKSNDMRIAAIKQKEDNREQKQNNGNYFLTKNKSYPYPPIDGKENNINKSKRNKNQSHSVPRHHRIRRNDFESEDNTSSVDEDNNDRHTRNKSIGRTVALSDNTRKKNPLLPPVRRGQGPPVYDPSFTYPLPYGHPLQRRYPYYDGYQRDPHGRSYEDVYDPHHRYIDYENRNTKSKSEKYGNNDNDPSYYNERNTFESPRQEREDDSKKNLKPNIPDAVNSQPWGSADSYLENQRRRTLRDSQGYYFPYKQYTLKDYKDLQKTELHYNPYGSYNGKNLDRKELAKRRQEYAAQIERPVTDMLGEEHKTPRDISPKKPLYFNNNASHDSEKLSKRDRAREYVRDQLGKHRLHKSSKNKTTRQDPTEQYISSLFPEVDENDHDEVNEQDNKNNEPHDDDDDK